MLKIFGKQQKSSGSNGIVEKRYQPAPPLESNYALLAYEKNPTLQSVCDKVAFMVATNGFKIYKKSTKGGSTDFAVGNARAEALLSSPNSFMTKTDFFSFMTIARDLVGSCYVYKMRAGDRIIGLYPMIPQNVTYLPESKKYRINLVKGGAFFDIPESDISIYKKISIQNPYSDSGVGIGTALAYDVDILQKAKLFIQKFFYNDATPPFIISLEGAAPEQVERFKEDWNIKHKGILNKFIPNFTNTKATVTQLATDFKSMQMSQIQKDQRDAIINSFGIPPELLGILENSNRATIESALFIMYTSVVWPRLISLCEWLDKALITEPDLYFWPIDNSPKDKDFLLKIIATNRRDFSRNEIREIAGFDPDTSKESNTIGYGYDYDSSSEVSTDEKVLNKVDSKKSDLAEPVVKSKKTVDIFDIESLLQLVFEKNKSSLLLETSNSYKGIYMTVMQDVLKDLGVDPSKTSYMDSVNVFTNTKLAKKIKRIDDVTRDGIRDELQKGIILEETLDELQERISKKFKEKLGSAERIAVIALTESHSTINDAIHETYVLAGIEEVEWLHHPEESETPRDEHAAMDGTRVRMGEKFKLSDGSEVEIPGNSGIAKHDINCHCTLGAVAPEKGMSNDSDYRELFVRKVKIDTERFARSISKAFKKGLDAQEADILKGLEDFDE